MTAAIDLAYLVASVLFILAVKGLTHPRTAVRGNLLGAAGMAIAVAATLAAAGISGYVFIVLGLALGAAGGVYLALYTPMTDVPQLVALFNGAGGGASALVAAAEMIRAPAGSGTVFLLAAALSAVIGAVTLSGSLLAFAKLQGLYEDKLGPLPQQQLVGGALGVGVLVLGVMAVVNPALAGVWFTLLLAGSLAYGVVVLLPVGGADMPVMIALLNSLSGVAAAAVGFVVSNTALIIAGSLVGASGLILTQIMCKAMNRSLWDVLSGSLATGASASADEVYAGKVKQTSADEVAMLLDTAQKVVIVPGYGMAVAQAQHAVRDLAKLLESRGAQVTYAIHPVAGRMPGHMNVLLAEADVDYDQLKELEVANPQFPQTDVAIVIGANDVVNPDAKNDPNSPIAGMPVLDVESARTVVVIKRSLSPGFAGIPNPLFAADNTLMLFGDGQEAVLELTRALKEV